MRVRIYFAIVAGAATLLATSELEERGRDVFARRCSGCHSIDRNMEGPRLRGVFGRKAAGIEGFGYSDSLKKSGLRWDEASLDRWLKDPESVARDTDMAFRLSDPGERKAVIAYLRTLRKQ